MHAIRGDPGADITLPEGQKFLASMGIAHTLQYS
jgi:hypothetical protein